MSNFNISEEHYTIIVYTCKKCGNILRFKPTESEELVDSYLSEHSRKCSCDHLWSEWHTINSGTWPDYEPCTSRYCNLCEKTEYL